MRAHSLYEHVASHAPVGQLPAGLPHFGGGPPLLGRRDSPRLVLHAARVLKWAHLVYLGIDLWKRSRVEDVSDEVAGVLSNVVVRLGLSSINRVSVPNFLRALDAEMMRLELRRLLTFYAQAGQPCSVERVCFRGVLPGRRAWVGELAVGGFGLLVPRSGLSWITCPSLEELLHHVPAEFFSVAVAALLPPP